MEFCTAKKNLIAASRAAGILALMLAAIFGWNMQAVFGQSQTGAGTTPLPPLIAAPGPYTAYTPPRSAANSSPAAPANQPAAPSYRPPQPKRLPTIAQPFNPADPFGGAAKTNSVSANPAPAQPAVPVAKPAPP